MRQIVRSLLSEFSPWAQEAVAALIAAALGIALALIAHRILYDLLQRIAKASESKADDVVVRNLGQPTRWAMVALGLVIAARETPALSDVWQKVAGFLMPALIGWIALAILHAFVRAVELRNEIDTADNLEARRVRTRLAIYSRIATFVIVFATIGLMLLSIPGVRDIGVTLMASAGIAGLAVGAAAQPALKSLIAGLQMALTEPIRIDDVVIIDGEWGKIEEIRTTYVVVKIWDERRLIVPTSKFLDETFENWTRKSGDLLGTVFLHLDPLAEIEPIRVEFARMVEAHPKWDRRVQKTQVTEARPESIEVRLLMSAANASDAFDLRCDIREGIMAWIRENQPEAIMRSRVEPNGEDLAAAEVATDN